VIVYCSLPFSETFFSQNLRPCLECWCWVPSCTPGVFSCSTGWTWSTRQKSQSNCGMDLAEPLKNRARLPGCTQTQSLKLRYQIFLSFAKVKNGLLQYIQTQWRHKTDSGSVLTCTTCSFTVLVHFMCCFPWQTVNGAFWSSRAKHFPHKQKRRVNIDLKSIKWTQWCSIIAACENKSLYLQSYYNNMKDDDKSVTCPKRKCISFASRPERWWW